MVYISNGQVSGSQSQSPWRLSLITDFFWGIAKFVVLFFKTLFRQDVKQRRNYGNSSDSRYDDGRGETPSPKK
uniref:Selenoprotein K n=1 Tax=Macaca fascicularis TaxID=9541 RepID=A0A7N9D005_MACFA